MSEKNWVPGFIWLTPRGQVMHVGSDGKHEWRWEAKPPMLVAVSQITHLEPCKRDAGSHDIANTCVNVCGNTETFVYVVETVEEIAELIRGEWQERTITTAIAGSQYGSGEYRLREGGA